jgi:hypothetical protein
VHEAFTVEGGWTWFGGPRAMSTDTYDFFGSVRKNHTDQRPGVAEIFISAVDRSTGILFSEVVLDSDVPEDDHSVPGLVFIEEDLILSGHTHHNSLNNVTLSWVSVTERGLEIVRQSTIPFPERCTYVYLLKFPGKILLLTRSIGFNWTGMWLSETGEQRSEPFVFLPWSINPGDPFYSGRDGNRPYLIVRQGANDSFIFVATNDHPRAYRNGVFAGRICENHIEDLEGNVVHVLGSPESWSPFQALTEILPSGQRYVPWIQDVAESRSGEIYVAVSGRTKSVIQFRAARDRSLSSYSYGVYRWNNQGVDKVVTIPAGTSLYPKEQDYVGGFAFNPLDPAHFVFSSQNLTAGLFPKADSPWKLWETRLDSEPANYRILSLFNQQSSIRPVFSVPSHAGSHSLYFLEGEYSSYRSIDTTVEHTIFDQGRNCFEFDSIHCDLPFPLDHSGHFPSSERELFESLLPDARHYLEFGSGSSTLTALSAGVPRITSIDSDGALLTALSALAPRYRAKEDNIFVPIPLTATYTGRWGYPKGKNSVNFVAQYRKTLRDAPFADLVLIDGRYRVAAFFEVLRNVTGPTTVLWDDYTHRQEYHIVEKYVGKPEIVGRMAIFTLHVSQKISWGQARRLRSLAL